MVDVLFCWSSTNADLTDIICRTSLLAYNVDSWQHFLAGIIIILTLHLLLSYLRIVWQKVPHLTAQNGSTF